MKSLFDWIIIGWIALFIVISVLEIYYKFTFIGISKEAGIFLAVYLILMLLRTKKSKNKDYKAN
ncbi:hypothetical protein HYW75_06445 [Candidatus Pacearchaeota archaeon]|nr:hypothetical protein [Candidatus Pacearchaeota archaeon]